MVNRNISIWRKFGREHATDVVYDAGVEDHHADTDLWRALQQLPPRQRAVIALRYYEDLSEADIARTLGCSVGTVKSQASKAMSKLRDLVPRDA
jgi:RNA polymerase sigma factor (sigma-70 family)